MNRKPISARSCRVVTASALLAVLTTACSQSSARPDPEPSSATPDTPGQVSVKVADIDLTITRAIAHLDASGNGTLTMTVRNNSGVPEHLDMVGTPDAGRGAIAGGNGKDSGSLDGAGILLRSGSTVTFGGGDGPTVRLTGVKGVTAAHTLPLALQFGVARLVRLSAIVSSD